MFRSSKTHVPLLERLFIYNFFCPFLLFIKGIYNTCAIHTQVGKQAIVAHILFAGFFGVFSTSINKILLDAQINEYNKKLSTTPNAYEYLQDNKNTTPTAPQLPTLHHNHPLSLIQTKLQDCSTSLQVIVVHKVQLPTS